MDSELDRKLYREIEHSIIWNIMDKISLYDFHEKMKITIDNIICNILNKEYREILYNSIKEPMELYYLDKTRTAGSLTREIMEIINIVIKSSIREERINKILK